MFNCALCQKKECRMGTVNKMASSCPSKSQVVSDSIKLYREEENRKIAYNAALVESEGYCEKNRIEEIMMFASKCEYRHIGVAFCVGLSREANTLHKILTANGFEVTAIACKNGGFSKDEIDIKDSEKLHPGKHESMCNPIGQALYLNSVKTDLNLILGLCVGHDSLFIKYSEAPVTVAAVKDRVLGHNPIQALYLADSYFSKKLLLKKD